MTTIRTAQSDDLSQLLLLYAELNPDDVPLSHNLARGLWMQLLERKGVQCWVAEENNNLLGTCMLAIIPNLTRGGRPFAVLENLVIARDNQRKGIGRLLLQSVTDEARKHGCYKVMLESNARRTDAHAFYRAMGFNSSSKLGFELRLP